MRARMWMNRIEEVCCCDISILGYNIYLKPALAFQIQEGNCLSESLSEFMYCSKLLIICRVFVV